MASPQPIPPSLGAVEIFLLAAGVAGLADAALVLAGRSLGIAAWAAVGLASVPLFAAFVLPIALAIHVALGVASRVPGLGALAGEGFRAGFAAAVGALLLPLLIAVNQRRPGFSLAAHHAMPYLGVLAGVLAVAVLAGVLVARFAPSGPGRGRVRRALWAGAGALALGALAVVVASAARAPASEPSPGVGPGPQPNLVLISIDTLRRDHLGIYGYGEPTDLAIQRHFADGLVFGDAVAPVPLTRPSHTAMLTGIHPAWLGVYSNYHRMQGDVTTLAEILHVHGYRTGAFVSGWPLFGETSGLDRGFDHYSDRFSALMRIHPAVADLTLPVVLQKLRWVDSVQRDAEEVTGDALAWLEAGPGEPFFLFVHYYDPHVYYEAPAAFLTEMGVPEGETRNHRWIISRIASGVRELAPDVERLSRALYDAEIRFADAEVGRLLDAIDELGLRDDTVVLLTADHGETLLERLATDGVAFDHGYTLDEHDIRIPFLLRGPGVPSGTSPLTATLDDIAPTLLARAGIPTPPGMTGGDLVAGDPGGPAVSFNQHHGGIDRITVREDGYKYTRLASGEERLEAIDGGKIVEAGLLDRRPAVASRLREIALGLPHPGGRAEVDPLEAERLRALGYVQ